MPAWWGKKSSKHKEEETQAIHGGGGGGASLHKSHAAAMAAARGRLKDKPKSFDDAPVARGGTPSPRRSRDFAGGGGLSGFSGFDSDGSRTHPLPRPSSSSVNDHVVAGMGSGSVSSVSSSGSSDDQPVVNDAAQLAHLRLGFFSIFFFIFRRIVD